MTLDYVEDVEKIIKIDGKFLPKIVKRDITVRGRKMEQVLYQYHRFVRPAHNEFVQPVTLTKFSNFIRFLKGNELCRYHRAFK